MIDTNYNFRETAKQTAAFQKIWMESMSKGMQAACTLSPGASPSELLLKIRSGIFSALTQSWEEFMRSPQFLEGMQKYMEHSVGMRKTTNDLFGKLRNEFQSPSREDVDTIMVSVRHIEKRLLDRVDDLSAQVHSFTNSQGKSAAALSVKGKPTQSTSQASPAKRSRGGKSSKK